MKFQNIFFEKKQYSPNIECFEQREGRVDVRKICWYFQIISLDCLKFSFLNYLFKSATLQKLHYFCTDINDC